MTTSSFMHSSKHSYRRTTYTEGFAAGLRMFLREFYAAAFSPYRPDRHYMRGPGPAWHAKHRQNAES